MSIEELIDRVIMSQQTIEIEYCTRSGHVFNCEITDIGYSQYYGGGYIVARRTDKLRNALASIMDYVNCGDLQSVSLLS